MRHKSPARQARASPLIFAAMSATRESISERKVRERREFAALPPAVAQRCIDLRLTEPLRDVTEPGIAIGSGLAPDDDDEPVEQ